MARHHQPRKGSVAFSPRKRAARESPHITSWPESEEPGLLGFPGYKVGMTHVTMLDNTKNSPTEGMEISTPVTVVETPPVVVFGIRAYKKTSRGIKAMTDVLAAELDQDLKRKISLPKEYNTETQLAELTENLDNVVEIRALVHTKPRLANVPKKKPEIMEFGVGGSSPKENWITLSMFSEKKLTLPMFLPMVNTPMPWQSPKVRDSRESSNDGVSVYNTEKPQEVVKDGMWVQ